MCVDSEGVASLAEDVLLLLLPLFLADRYEASVQNAPDAAGIAAAIAIDSHLRRNAPQSALRHTLGLCTQALYLSAALCKADMSCEVVLSVSHRKLPTAPSICVGLCM